MRKPTNWQREVLSLIERGVAPREIARHYGCSRQAVYLTLKRARKNAAAEAGRKAVGNAR